jgi:hypothetical protein
LALAPFFDRIYGAIGGHLAVSRDSLASVLNEVVVGIQCDDRTNNDRWICEMTTNIVARLYPQISISGPAHFAGELKRLAQSINPSITIAPAAPTHTTIATGSRVGDSAIVASASGWVAGIDADQKLEGPSNPYAAMAAGALACGKLFRRVFLNTAAESGFSVSLLNYDRLTGSDVEVPAYDLADVWFAGVGAVGSAALWALGRDTSLKGTFHLIDAESLSLLNLQRYVSGGFRDVGTTKIALGQRLLAHSKLVTALHQTSLESFADSHAINRSTTIVVSVDNVATRRAAQALLPKLVVNGWTGEQALGASWHEFDHDSACLACLYHPRKQGSSATEQAANALGLSVERASILWISRQPLSESDIASAAQALGTTVGDLRPWLGKPLGDLYTDVVCGAVPLDVTGLGRVETVPLAHQSVLAGALVCAELLKRTNSVLSRQSNPEVLVSYDNVLKPPPQLWTKPRPREPGCICGDDDYQDAYRSKFLNLASS